MTWKKGRIGAPMQTFRIWTRRRRAGGPVGHPKNRDVPRGPGLIELAARDEFVPEFALIKNIDKPVRPK